MQNFEDIDGYLLGAFVDGQLDADNCELIINAMEQDAGVRERVYKLRRAKDLMQLGFAPVRPVTTTKSHRWNFSRFGLVASLLFAVVMIGAGYLGYYGGKKLASETAQVFSTGSQLGADRVLLHLGESDSKQFGAVLAYARKFLEKHRYSDAQITVIANAGGLDLLRAGVSPYEEQVMRLMRDYENVHFIACANSIRALRKKGIKPEIIANIDSSLPAMDQIIKHVQDGWSYIKVGTLLDS